MDGRRVFVMTRELKRLEKLGPTIDAELNARDELSEVRKRLEGRVRTKKRVSLLAIAAPIAAAAAIILAVFVMRRPLTMTVSDMPATVGTFIAADAAPVPIRFNDGTEIAVQPNARARVVAVSHKGARLVLERGTVAARVIHRDNAEWHVAAGPFDVHVIGTKFEASWDPAAETFRIDLLEGAVMVSGGMLDRGSRVSAGETLRIDVRAGRMDLVKTSTLATAPTSDPVQEVPTVKIDPPSAPTQAPSTTTSPRLWQSLANSGKYNAALEAAKQAGFGHECEHGSAADVLQLGDVARLAGDVPRAQDAYRAVRKRFPKTGYASTAAFSLGRVAFERQHAYAEAATWFETALREGGPFARDAAGRLIEAKKAGGDMTGAKAAARNYLDRWPTGPHATLAKGLVSE
jgi:transmembrane sensor